MWILHFNNLLNRRIQDVLFLQSVCSGHGCGREETIALQGCCLVLLVLTGASSTMSCMQGWSRDMQVKWEGDCAATIPNSPRNVSKIHSNRPLNHSLIHAMTVIPQNLSRILPNMVQHFSPYTSKQFHNLTNTFQRIPKNILPDILQNLNFI